MSLLDRDAIGAAHALIRPHVRETPVIGVAGGDLALADVPLTLKLELLQHSGSFKARGAFMNLLARRIPPAGVVAASGGNHGAAVAFAARRLGVPARVYVPTVASPAKLAQIRAYGAELVIGTGGEDYSDESDPGPMPIPLDAPIEGGSAADPDPASGDRHLLVLQEGSCTLYELYNTERVAGGFRVSSSATWDLTVNDMRPAGWTSADAAGLPILPGLLRHEEAAAGGIARALRFTMPQVRRAYVAPASHCGSYPDAARPPYGLRVRLRASFDLSGYAGHARTVLAALKTYGLILADQGSAWYVTGTSHPGWADALDQLRARPVRGRDFEVVRMGPVTTC
ncbi:MAG: pyridoxal-phosphate dependent enzyme [Gemmatimonadales bacterium]